MSLSADWGPVQKKGKNKMDNDTILNGWRKYVKNAKAEDVVSKLDGLWDWIQKSPQLKDLFDNIKLSYNMIKDTLNGSYTGLSKGNLALLVAALSYLVLPIDLVPDIIPVAGLLDDCVVLGWVFIRVKDELAKYKAHCKQNRRTIEIT